MSKKIIFSGGGTGGHLLPAINLMKHFYEKKYEVLLITDQRGDQFIKKDRIFKSYIINAGTPTQKKIIKRIFSYFLIFYSVIKSIIIIKKEKPDLVFGFGGYVSFPVSYASKFFKIPLVIYENNMILGRANKYLLPFSKKVFLAKKIKSGISENFQRKTCIIGPILNKNIINCSPFKEKNTDKNFSILVLGGSQGAKIFGEIIPQVIKMIKDEGCAIEIFQQCIKQQKNSIIDFYKKNNIKSFVFEYEKNILNLALSSNLAITRAGASTTAELLHTLTPFIAIPLPNSIDNHQYLNAKYYENQGCCWLLDQKNLNTENLFKLIVESIRNKNKLASIQENMKRNCNKNVFSNVER